MEDWVLRFLINEFSQEKKDDEELGDWDFLYGATELFTNNRKRN